METENAAAFEQLPMVRSEIPASLIGMYRVYKDEKNFSVVQASSALEALENSKLGHALRIERESFYKVNLMNPKFWDVEAASAPQPTLEDVAPQVAAVEVKAEEAPADAPPSGEAPLSNNDVDKLLNG